MRILFILLFLPVMSFAEDLQDLNQLKQTAENFLVSQIGRNQPGKVAISVGELDSRLSLSACPTEQLKAYLAPGQTAVKASLVGVRCESLKPWSLYLPVKVRLTRSVLIAKQNIAQGMQLNSDLVGLAEMDVNALAHGYMTDKEALIGKISNRPVSEGKPITEEMLTSPKIINRGDSVLMRANAKGIQVTQKGIALGTGGVGDTIKIQSISSKRIINGKIVGVSEVEVDF